MEVVKRSSYFINCPPHPTLSQNELLYTTFLLFSLYEVSSRTEQICISETQGILFLIYRILIYPRVAAFILGCIDIASETG